MITQRAYLVGFVGFCFYLIALVNSLPPLYYTLAWLSVGIIVSSFGVALLSLQGLTCLWRVIGGRAGELIDDDTEKEGAERAETGVRLEIDVANAGTLNKTGVALDVRLYDVRRDRMRSQQFLIEALPSGANLGSELPLHAHKHGLPRGRYAVSDVWLVGSDVLGLFRARKRADAGLRRLRVYALPSASIETLATALESSTGHERDVCLAVAVKAHYEGSAVCFRGTPGECNRIVAALSAVGFDSKELSDATEPRWKRTRRRPLARQRRVRFSGREVSGRELEALARRAQLVPGSGFELVIGPAMVRLDSLFAQSSGGEARDGLVSRLPGAGEEFRGTRPYVPGDDLRRVHWASSARSGELVVREFLRPAQEGAVVVWDGAALPKEGANTDASESEREESGLRLAASLCRAILERGRPCGLVRLDAHPVYLSPTIDGGGYAALGRVIEALSDARSDRKTSISEALSTVTGARIEGEVFLVTTAQSADLGAVRDAARLWRARGAQVRVVWVETPAVKTGRSAKGGARNGDETPPFETGTGIILRMARPDESRLAPVREALVMLLNAPSHARRPMSDAHAGLSQPAEAKARA